MKKCPACNTDNSDESAVCHHCGGWLSDQAASGNQPADVPKDVPQAKSPVVKAAVAVESSSKQTEVPSDTTYFSVSTTKLITLSVLTFGLYELYWFYKNWKIVKVQQGVKLSPFWRTFFTIFFCYSLFKKMLISAHARGYEGKESAATLAVTYIAISMIYRFPDPFWMLCLLTFIPIIQVQAAIDFNNKQLDDQYQPSSKF